MFNFLIHYPCHYALSDHYFTTCGSWPLKLKQELIDGVAKLSAADSVLEDGDYFTADNVSVTVIPAFISKIASDQMPPILVTVYIGSNERVIFSRYGNQFKKVFIDSLLSVFGKEHFVVHQIVGDLSYAVPSS